MTGAGRRVLVAMSGGVDSSVAAALLVEAGYEVIGATMQLWPADEQIDGERGFPAAVDDAGRVAAALGICHHVFDMRDVFAREVIGPFVAAYLGGITPNPCLGCNTRVKFGALLQRARALDVTALATGHYVVSGFDRARRRYLLWRGKDRGKEQSYALYGLNQEQLSASLFPLGRLTKSEVRGIARRLQLPVAEKGESQEICFVPDKDYAGFIAGYQGSLPRNQAPSAGREIEALTPGPILDRAGRVLGRHKGLARYTVGQRRGLGIAAPKPLYVLEIRTETNELVVGPETAIYSSDLTCGEVNWIGLAPPLPERIEAEVKIRYSAEPAAAAVYPQGETGAYVRFRKPQRAVTPGQAAVFYRGDEVLGGGTILAEAYK